MNLDNDSSLPLVEENIIFKERVNRVDTSIETSSPQNLKRAEGNLSGPKWKGGLIFDDSGLISIR